MRAPEFWISRAPAMGLNWTHLLTLEWLVLSVLGTGGHETWHLILNNILAVESEERNVVKIYLSKLDLLAAEGGEGQVSDLKFSGWGSRHCSIFWGGVEK